MGILLAGRQAPDEQGTGNTIQRLALAGSRGDLAPSARVTMTLHAFSVHMLMMLYCRSLRGTLQPFSYVRGLWSFIWKAPGW